MRAMLALIDAGAAKAPGTIEADIAIPVVVVREGGTRLAKCAFL